MKTYQQSVEVYFENNSGTDSHIIIGSLSKCIENGMQPSCICAYENDVVSFHWVIDYNLTEDEAIKSEVIKDTVLESAQLASIGAQMDFMPKLMNSVSGYYSIRWVNDGIDIDEDCLISQEELLNICNVREDV